MKEHPTYPHWYLVFVGTRPEGRGKGLASGVIRTVTDECDRTNMPAYLENSNPLNTPLYERYGFKVQKTVTMGKGKIPIELMLREPQKADNAVAV